MKYNKGFAPIIILIIISIVAGGAYYAGQKHGEKKVNTEFNTSANASVQYPNINKQTNTSITTSVKVSIDSFKVVKPYLYIYAHSLSEVKVLGISTGTGVTGAHVLGMATLQGTNDSGVQTWVFKPGEVLLTSMSVQGYAGGSLIGTLQLPFSGASEIYETFN